MEILQLGSIIGGHVQLNSWNSWLLFGCSRNFIAMKHKILHHHHSNLSQTNLVLILTHYFPDIQFNTIPSAIFQSLKHTFVAFLNHNFLCTICFTHLTSLISSP